MSRMLGRMVFSCLAGVCAMEAGGMPSADAVRTVVVVNADSWASVCIADEYMRLRGIPPDHRIALSGIGSFERLPVADFRTQILGPVLEQMEARGLAETTHVIAYSADLPTSIDVSGDLKGRETARILAPQASINGLTFFAAAVMAGETWYLALDANPYAGKFPGQRRDRRWKPEEQQQMAQALEWLKKPSPGDPSEGEFAQKLAQAAAVLDGLRARHGQSPVLLYNIACCHALAGRSADAVAALREAVANGWHDVATTRADKDFAAIHDTPEFTALLDEMGRARIEVQPHVPFAGVYDGKRYWLSAVLACTSGRGLSVEESLAALRRSAAADGTRPAGTVYYMKNGDVRSTTREWAFADAAGRLNALGVKAVVQDGVLPQKQPPTAGVMVGAAGFNWGECGTEILPGAIGEHLTSCGGMMGEFDGQTPLTEFLRHGAAGAAGTVTEPYALQGKFPNAYVHWFYAQGASLAEAFYESVTGPYQLLIVGDPLCRPWGPAPEPPAAGAGTPPPARTVPPAPRPALAAPEGVAFADGLALHIAGQAPVAVAKLDGALFAACGETEACAFELEGWFDVEADAVHQFQVGGSARINGLAVDGQVVVWRRGEAPWAFVPVSLAKGLHRVVFSGTARRGQTLDIRFGGAGTRRLAAPHFRHLPP